MLNAITGVSYLAHLKDSSVLWSSLRLTVVGSILRSIFRSPVNMEVCLVPLLKPN